MARYKTLNELFLFALEEHGNLQIFFTKNSQKQFEGLTLNQLFRKAQNLGIELMEMGLEPGDKVGLISDNRLEWMISDIAVLINGAIDVPRGSDSTSTEILYILEHSESKFCFVENERILKTLSNILENINIQKVIIMDKKFSAETDKIKSLHLMIERGEAKRNSRIRDLDKRLRAVRESDLFTIIYTSGTTGMPKGVMLTHGNMVYNTAEVPSMVGMEKYDRALSILPIWHIFERGVEYCSILLGVCTYYTNVREIREDFQKVKPTFLASAPRLWESIFSGIKGRLEKGPILQKILFDTAYEINKNWKESVDYLQGNTLKVKEEEPLEKLNKTIHSFFTSINLFLPAKILDAVVFSKVREGLGGKLKGTISGGGALPPHVDEFFNVIGLPVYEGYGMTECSPIICVRPMGKLVQGTVGITPYGTEVKILNEQGYEVGIGELGVIHVKGPQVMKGYYKNEEATQKSFREGWLNTGDLGFRSLSDTITIKGRVKDTIVLLGGENVEPVPIENLLVEHPLINQIVIVGQDKKTLGALIWPDLEKLGEAGFQFVQGSDLNLNSKLRQHFLNIIKNTISSNNGFKSFERVTDFRFLPKVLEINDEITSLYKIKRAYIYEKYAALIQKMYE